MNNYNLKITVNKPFANLYRKRHVLVVPIDQRGRIVTGKKDFFPDGISRLIGGGVDVDEDYYSAALRELKEETGYLAEKTDLIPLALIKVETSTPTEKFRLDNMIYVIKLKHDNISPRDDVDKFVFLTKDELSDLSQRYLHLEGTFTRGKYSHDWKDYGKMYGPIHQIVCDELVNGRYII